MQSRTNDSNEHNKTKITIPKTKEQWFQEGINHYHAGDYTKSLLACEQAIQLDANYARAYYGKGLTLRRCGNDQEALLAFEQAIQLDAAYMKAYMGFCEKGLAIYDQAIRLNLNNAVAYERKGDIFQLYLKRNDDAVAAYDQAALLDPNFTTTKASFLFEIDCYDEAACAYDQVLKLHPNDAVAHFMKGVSHLYAGRNEEALASFEQVIQLDPDDVITHYKKGKALFGCGRYEEALATFKKTISFFYDRYILSKYDKARHYDESRSIGEIYADISKLFSGLEGFQDALADLEQCYEDICKKIDKK